MNTLVFKIPSEFSKEKDVMLLQEVAPSIRAQATLVHGALGKSVQLRCSASVPFDTKISWHRIDGHNRTKSRFRQQQYAHGDAIQTNLNLKDLERSDFGVYGCFAESTAGQTHAIVELRELRRSSTTQMLEKSRSSTSRTQILKRNKIPDKTTRTMMVNKASSTCFSFIYLSFLLIQMNLLYLT